MIELPTIFLSYPWVDKKIADIIDADFSKLKIPLIRDERDAEYRTSIKEFMQQIGKSDLAIMLISDSFLKSKNCIYEVLELLHTNELEKRILPVIIDENAAYNTKYRNMYYDYWDNEIVQTKKNLDKYYTEDYFNEFKHLNNIRKTLDIFFVKLSDLKSENFHKLKMSNYSPILKIICNSDTKYRNAAQVLPVYTDTVIGGKKSNTNRLSIFYKQAIENIKLTKYLWVAILLLQVLMVLVYTKETNSKILIVSLCVFLLYFLGMTFSYYFSKVNKTGRKLFYSYIICLYLIAFSAITTVGYYILSGKQMLHNGFFQSQNESIVTNQAFALSYSNQLKTTPEHIISNIDLYKFIHDWIGSPYKWGGCTKDGVDGPCFTSILFKSVYKLKIERTTFLQFKENILIYLDKKDHQTGDLIFFKTPIRRETKKNSISHVGVYLINGYFVHCSAGGVKISNLNFGTWKARLVAAGRPKDSFYGDAGIAIPKESVQNMNLLDFSYDSE